MVSSDIVNAHEKLINRKRLYDRANRIPNLVSRLGALILFLSAIPLLPLMLETIFEGSFLYSYIGGFIVGIIINGIGEKLKKRNPLPLSLSLTEKQFLRIFDVLKELDMYLENDVEFEISRLEATKLLSKVEKYLYDNLYDSKLSPSGLWRVLTKDVYEKLELLNSNLNKKILLTLENGKKEDVVKIYPMLEDVARYFLEPSFSKLDSLNEPMSKLPSHEIYYIRNPFFERYPYFRHIVAVSFILLIGYAVFHLGTNYLRVSSDNAYIAAIAFIGSLSAGYLGYLAINIKRGS